MPANLRSTATATEVCPAVRGCERASGADSCTKLSLPTTTVRSSITAVTPLVAISWASSLVVRVRPRWVAASITPVASTCDEYCSADAASCSSSSASKPGSGITSTSSGSPCESVPVLSNAADLARESASIVAPPFTITPLRALALMPPMKATGAAISSGHGVASTSTSANRTGSPDSHQANPAIARETRVNGTAKRSATRTVGALDSSAAFTSAMICWYCDDAASAVARTRMTRSPLTDPEYTASPRVRVTGRLSPVSEDSSNSASSLSSSQSTGTTSAGLMSSRSPAATSLISISSTAASDASLRSRCAVCGARSSSALRSFWARCAA